MTIRNCPKCGGDHFGSLVCPMLEMTEVAVADGKYTVVLIEGGGMRFLRYGEPWPAADESFGHAGLVLAMAQEIRALRAPAKEPERVADDGTVRKVHYGAGRQPWDDIVDAGWGPAFAAGNALKYVRRAAAKNGEDDLAKGRWYYARLVEMMAGDGADGRSAMVAFTKLIGMLAPAEKHTLEGKSR